MIIELTPEQKGVIASVLTWLKNSRQQSLTLGGYAGTGKTLVVVKLRQVIKKLNPKLKVAFCAYTGKAARVLMSYLQMHQVFDDNDSVSTIHSLIYAPMTNNQGQITGWMRKQEIEADLIVVDEASMVDEAIWRDLLAFGLPVLAVGDHGQLPPIKGKFNLMNQPEMKLEKIHRQAQDNPIIKLSMRAREEGVIPVGSFGQGVRKLDRYDSASGQEVEEMLRRYNPEMLILTGFNQTRIRLNQQLRHYLEIMGEEPMPGDQLICLKNNWNKGIYNGMVGQLKRIKPAKDSPQQNYEVELEFEEDQHFYSGMISREQFNQAEKVERGYRSKVDLFDFGYALTVHKAQGSQAPEVLLFEERSQYMDDDEWRRWLYTGITRAEEYLTVVGV